MSELLVSGYLIISLVLMFLYLQWLKFKHKKKLNEIDNVGFNVFSGSVCSLLWTIVTPIVIIMFILDLISENLFREVW